MPHLGLARATLSAISGADRPRPACQESPAATIWTSMSPLLPFSTAVLKLRADASKKSRLACPMSQVILCLAAWAGAAVARRRAARQDTAAGVRIMLIGFQYNTQKAQKQWSKTPCSRALNPQGAPAPSAPRVRIQNIPTAVTKFVKKIAARGAPSDHGTGTPLFVISPSLTAVRVFQLSPALPTLEVLGISLFRRPETWGQRN